MKHDQQQEKWVNEALDSLAGIQRAEANPFLYTRIRERMARPATPWEKLTYLLSKPAFAVMLGVCFVAINFYVATRQEEAKLVQQQQTSEQLFAAEYAANDLNNDLNASR
jgi:hypothetical protein